MLERAARCLQRDIFKHTLRIAAALDSCLFNDLARRHWRPVVAGVAYEVFVRARNLALDGRERFETRLDDELLANIYRGEGAPGWFCLGRRQRQRRSVSGLDTTNELQHFLIARIIHDDHIIVANLAQFDE